MTLLFQWKKGGIGGVWDLQACEQRFGGNSAMQRSHMSHALTRQGLLRLSSWGSRR
jgi:hypothetical protein